MVIYQPVWVVQVLSWVLVLDCAQENSGEHVSFKDRAVSVLSGVLVSPEKCCGQLFQVLWSVLSGIGCGTLTGLWSVLSGTVVSSVQVCGSILSLVSCCPFTGLWSVLSGAVVSSVQCWL